MTFTGCWTCKARKVRCDERPFTCKNCEKRGIPCGGYDIRLQLVSDPFAEPDMVATSNKQGRRRILLDTVCRYREEEIDAFLSSIEYDVGSGLSSKKGPFSIFPLHTEDPDPSQSLVLSLGGLGEGQAGWSSDEYLAGPIGTDPDYAQDTELQDLELAQASPQFEYSYNPSSGNAVDVSGDFHIHSQSRTESGGSVGEHGYWVDLTSAHGQLSENSPTCDWDDALSHSGTTPLSTSPTLSHLTLVPIRHIASNAFGDGEAVKLMHHYLDHVADLLQPILHTQNPYRSLYAAAAFEGTQAAVDSSTPGEDYKFWLMAILSLCTIGVISGDGDFKVHLDVANKLRNSRKKWRLISGSTRQLNEIGAFLALVARTVSFEATLSPWLGIAADIPHTDDTTIQSSSRYEYMYGITPAIAAMIQETYRLGEFVAHFERQQQPIPDDLLQACETLGDTLLSWSLENERISSVVTSDDLMMTLFNHQAKAWHYGALIYYYRRIQHYEPMDVRKEVQDIIEHLDSAEDVKSRSKSRRAHSGIPVNRGGTE
ncbi:hypothetical protein N7449_012407 [Penicillium cf. viridicatum]|uniref:Zn(2)-C6 fungal-type domain-containing protein n=1 Tax=Penicillium cf. viridicatum TaxID=2972119 RepID=A0A9W9LYG9_9EURO|nr:hypothetical protein N7449_012407 [Penicillium cf. viridicatum]